MKKEITYGQMLELSLQCNLFLIEKEFLVKDDRPHAPSPYKQADKPATKLSQGINSILKQIDKLMPDYNERKVSIQEEHAVTDKNDHRIIYEKDGRTPCWTPEGKKKVRAGVKALNEEKVTIYTRIQEEQKVDLELYSMFNGILVPEVKLEEEFDTEA